MNREITLEVCCNLEWLRENSGIDLDQIDNGYENEAAGEFESQLHSRLTAEGFETTRPNGQRILYHGWNGANTFRHLLGPVGTFDSLTSEQQNQIWICIEDALTAAQSAFPREEDSECN